MLTAIRYSRVFGNQMKYICMVKFLFFSDKIFTPSNVSVACLIPDDSRAQDQDMAANNIQAQNPRIEEMDNPMDNSNRSSNNSSNNRSNQNQSKE